MKKILILLFTLSVSFQVLADNLSDTNSFFRWAEKQYPEYFSPSGSETFEIQDYLARRYSKDTYLGTQGTSVFVYSPLLFKGEITRVGVISDFIGVYNQDAYDQIKLELSQDDEYKSLKENLNEEAIEGDLGENFVGNLEDEILKLLVTTKEHRVDTIRKKLDPLVTNKLLRRTEQQAIVSIYSDFIHGDIPKAQASAAEFVVMATTDFGKLMAPMVQGYVDKSTCDQFGCESSTAEDDGEFIGEILGAVAGAAIGNFIAGPLGAIIGGKLGASLGGNIGRKIGGFFKKLFGGSGFKDDPDCNTYEFLC